MSSFLYYGSLVLVASIAIATLLARKQRLVITVLQLLLAVFMAFRGYYLVTVGWVAIVVIKQYQFSSRR